MIDWLVESRNLNRLILAGTQEITAELRNLLPKHLVMRIIGQVDVGMEVLPSDVLAATMRIAQEYEQDAEVQKVNEVDNSRRQKPRKPLPVSDIRLRPSIPIAFGSWSIARTSGRRDVECARCGGLFSTEKTSCQYCGGKLQAINNVVETAVEHALRNRARVHAVTGEAGASLATSGGIAAFLKARTGTCGFDVETIERRELCDEVQRTFTCGL